VPAHEDLLRQFQPVVRFDSHEAFFAHSVSAMAENARFRLVRDQKHSAENDYVIHAPSLNPDFLALNASNEYPNGREYCDGDHFGLDLNGPDQFVDKVGDYRELERQIPAGLRNRVYGRAVPADENATDVWLQYWYFYIYNDAQFSGRFDLHEGDWEMVQLLVSSGKLSSAAYAQHSYCESKDASQMDFDPALNCPIVYSGRGSHASYFERGLHQTHVKLAGLFLPLWWDAADGAGPHIRQELEFLDSQPWVNWKGRWGGTRPGPLPLDGESPGGPVTQGDKWTNPTAFAAKSIDHKTKPLPEAAPVIVRRSGQCLRVRFDFVDEADPPDRLVLTATPEGEPPITETIVVDSLARGRVFTRRALDPDSSYLVDASTISVNGVPTRPGEKPIRLRPRRALSPATLFAVPLRALDRFWMWVGALLTRRAPRKKA
jgi:hypothetical protein